MTTGITPENIEQYQRDAADGQRAEHLLSDPTLSAVIYRLKTATLEMVLNSDPGSARAAAYHHQFIAIAQVEMELKAMLEKGVAASKIIKEYDEERTRTEVSRERVWIEAPSQR